MIDFKQACEVARGIRDIAFPSMKYIYITELGDRWAFVLSVFSPEDREYMTPAPMFFVFAEDGHVEWFTVPPFENLKMLENGRDLGVLRERNTKILDREKANQVAEEYCEKAGFSVELLRGLYKQMLSGNLCYIAFPNQNADGLKNDIETQGVPVLKVTNEYAVSETEYTRQYLT